MTKLTLAVGKDICKGQYELEKFFRLQRKLALCIMYHLFQHPLLLRCQGVCCSRVLCCVAFYDLTNCEAISWFQLGNLCSPFQSNWLHARV